MNKIRSCDRFGENVSVNYEGEGDYKTLGGAIVTIIIQMIVLAFAFI